jgi:hypothetical protein
MTALGDSTIWFLAIVQLAGLATAAAARHHQGRHGQGIWQAAFLICLLLGGIGTLSALAVGPCCCTICGAAQACSVLTAVWEFPGAPQAAAH